MSELTKLNLQGVIQGLRRGEFSCRELIQAYFERIQSLDFTINAYLYTDEEGALRKAEMVDRTLAEWRRSPQGELPPLLGVPLAVKDVLCVKGMPCTCGSKILEGFVPPYNATSVQKLLEAGAIVLGKTNTDEFAMGSSTENSAYGVTRNPWNLNRVPGGSSGGSAAAVAARLAPVALGTDTGGSVRQPASFCGVSGIKPTYGRVSRYGLVAYGSSLDVVGVLGRNMEDLALVFELMAGVDPRDATTVDLPVPHIHLDRSTDLSAIRVGVPKEYFIPGMQPQVEAAIRQAILHLQELGATVLEVSLPHTEYALPVYYLIAPAEASANLARYDGIRYGPRLGGEAMWEIFFRTRGEKFGPEVKRRIMLGTYALSAGYYDAYYGKAQKVRTLIKQDFERAFQIVDVIAAPIAPTTAFAIGEHTDDPLAMYLEDVFTLPANLAGVPGVAFPVGFDQQGLPIGMQLMGNYFQEELLFRIAHAYQLTTDWHLRTPQ
ncbi:MAG: Asp-tRNA(Asn)/Glu-tRNA(Gln) amidotransferase subunit GatA [Anaerolineales bacterium]|nr:Asp-tRNA(Asn)/Glu-tRNA(Gln) amidotransferase subunit GatA [Anaerolineales bacterium]MDW8161256.1 Asp-tRNA(Asn)/Glu-tRNA(Gln) amidotransferase subunit GatA [Anaerolineales bacterium]